MVTNYLSLTAMDSIARIPFNAVLVTQSSLLSPQSSLLSPRCSVLAAQSSLLSPQSPSLSPDQASVAGKFPEAVDPDCKRTGSDHPLSKAASMPVVEKVIE